MQQSSPPDRGSGGRALPLAAWFRSWLVHMFGENLNPGMGVRFVDLKPEQRERLVATIHTIAYLRQDPSSVGEN